MGTLETAVALADDITKAQDKLHEFLLPILKEYIDLRLELNPKFFSYAEDKNADFRFKDVDANHFEFAGDETYIYGDYHTPAIDLPFAYVQDPKGYSQHLREQVRQQEETRAAKNRQAAEDRVANLQRQLAVAQRNLEKVEDTSK